MKKYLPRFIVLILAVVAVVGHLGSYDKMAELRKDFADEFEIAMSTPRMGIASEIRELRDIQKQLDDLTVVPWAAGAKEDLLKGMGQVIRGFLAFQGQEDASAVTTWFDRAKMSFDAYDARSFTR